MNRIPFLIVLITSSMLGCNNKNSDTPEDVSTSSDTEIVSQVEEEAGKTDSDKSFSFKLDNSLFVLGDDNSESNALESTGFFSIVVSCMNDENSDVGGTFTIKFEGNSFVEGVKTVKTALLTFNSTEEDLPMAYSSSGEKFELEITQAEVVKSESMAGTTITDYTFSGTFSGTMKGVDANGTIQTIEIKDGNFENLSFTQIKKM